MLIVITCLDITAKLFLQLKNDNYFVKSVSEVTVALLQNGINLPARKTTSVSDSVGAPITNRAESSHAPQGPRILQIASTSWFISTHSPLADQTVFRYNPENPPTFR